MLAVGYALRPLANFDPPLVWRVWRRLHMFTYQCQMSHNLFAQIHIVPIPRFTSHMVSMFSVSADQVSDAIGSGWETESNERTTSKVKCISSVSHGRRFWQFFFTYYALLLQILFPLYLTHHISSITQALSTATTTISLPHIAYQHHHRETTTSPASHHTHLSYYPLHHTHTASKPSSNNGIPAEHLLHHLFQHSHRRPRESPSMALPHVLRRVPLEHRRLPPPPPPSLAGRLPAEAHRAGGTTIGARACRGFCPGGVGALV
jgi:hypothetical protein